MTGENWLRVLFFCLATGAGMGALYAVLSGVRALLRAGKLLTAVLDILFCLVCGTVVFLCALAVDKGRLRAYQAGTQLLAGWAAAVTLEPLVRGSVLKLQRIFAGLTNLLQKNLQKNEKKDLKNP